MSAPPIQSIAALAGTDGPLGDPTIRAVAHPPAGTSFSQMLLSGVDEVNKKLVDADAMTKAFALDDSIPVHQVTYALEQARLSFELLLQVRTRLVESYQEFSRMTI